MVRLVKGAYWDTEVKRAQERGLADYPVFTRKPMTDLCYAACARKLLAQRARLYPQFATHNALTVASVIEDAGGVEGYEFQRLHGMGETLYDLVRADYPARPAASTRRSVAIAIFSPIWCGACWRTATPRSSRWPPILRCRSRRFSSARRTGSASRARAQPEDPLAGRSLRSRATQFRRRRVRRQSKLDALLADIRAGATPGEAAPIDGRVRPGVDRVVRSPIDGEMIGRVAEGSDALASAAMAAAQSGFARWAETADRHARRRARARERSAGGPARPPDRAAAGRRRQDARRCGGGGARGGRFLPLLRARGAPRARPQPLPGPTGESNELGYRGRGVFVCISPWNFPLSIFLGQVAAALVAGNSVVAKPAEQTPLVAAETVRILHAAGIPPGALHLLPGDGKVGAALVADARVAGVAFTGSTEVARAINRALAGKDAPIVPLIAETGGINPMIVDATALPEQVTGRRRHPRPSARPASAARRCACFACRRTWPTPWSR